MSKKYNNDLQFVTTEDELKKAYREACKKYHPDKGGSKEAFQALQKDYERIFASVKGIHRKKDGTTYHQTTKEKARDFIHIINELMKHSGLTIEILGSFLWVGGKTKDCKEALKKLGLKYASKKKMWYKAPEGYHGAQHKEFTIQKIRSIYKNNYSDTTDKNSVALSY